MFSSDRVLTLDIGSSKVSLAEFSVKNAGQPVLVSCAAREVSGADSVSGMEGLSGVVRELLAEMGAKPAPLLVTLSGQLVFPRTVKVPAVSGDKLAGLISNEATQCLPFPTEEVVWDYRVLEEDDATELEVTLFAVKNEVSNAVAECAEQSGLRLDLVDASYLALYNSVRYNYPELAGCTMVLDIGSKSTNLIFIEGERFFVRSISIGGATVTHEIARGLGLSEAEAEEVKKSKGFVALGGTYAVADDEEADKVSKIIRNVVTRLHSEIGRSVTFFRQHGGQAPDSVLLTGGTSLTRHLDTFFKEKMGIPVEYLNPFKNAAVSESGNFDSETLFLLASSVGLALRKCMECPAEVDLTPPSVVAAHKFSRRLPFFGISAASLVLTLLCWYFYADKLQAIYQSRESTVSAKLKVLERDQRKLKEVKSEVDGLVEKNRYLSSIAASRSSYVDVLNAVRNSLLPGMWVTSFSVSGNGLDLTVCGYEDELIKVQEESGGKSASEKLVDSLTKTRFFLPEGSSVIKDTMLESGYVREVRLHFALKEKLGVVKTVDDSEFVEK